MLENPVAKALGKPIVRRLALQPGMRVLDVGAGPGRMSLEAARIVGPRGEVVALDVQEEMLERLAAHASDEGLTNVRVVRGGAGTGAIEERDHFDRALLGNVLGEIPADLRAAAIREIHDALKPGGMLVVSEDFTDPHYRSPGTVRRLGEAAGLRVKDNPKNPLGHVMRLVKPA